MEVLLTAIGVSERSFARRKAAPKTRLPVNESERLWRFAEVLAHATRVFSSQAEAEQWLGRPAIGLDHRKSIVHVVMPALRRGEARRSRTHWPEMERLTTWSDIPPTLSTSGRSEIEKPTAPELTIVNVDT